jgi:hypothetical protein
VPRPAAAREHKGTAIVMEGEGGRGGIERKGAAATHEQGGLVLNIDSAAVVMY